MGRDTRTNKDDPCSLVSWRGWAGLADWWTGVTREMHPLPVDTHRWGPRMASSSSDQASSAAASECMICLEPLPDEAERKRLTCGHPFHPDCAWTLRSATCPVCRKAFASPLPVPLRRAPPLPSEQCVSRNPCGSLVFLFSVLSSVVFILIVACIAHGLQTPHALEHSTSTSDARAMIAFRMLAGSLSVIALALIPEEERPTRAFAWAMAFLVVAELVVASMLMAAMVETPVPVEACANATYSHLPIVCDLDLCFMALFSPGTGFLGGVYAWTLQLRGWALRPASVASREV
jgi:hypothetical protein